MSFTMIPLTPEPSLSIDDIRLGTVKSFSEKTVFDTYPVHAIDRNAPATFIRGPRHYEIHFSRLLHSDELFSQPLFDQMQNFTLKITCGDKEILFSGCEFTSLSLNCAPGNGILQEATICAVTRTET